MSAVYLCSDTHLFHKNISKARTFVVDTSQNTEFFLRDYHVVKSDDIVIFCGDVAFEEEGLEIIRKLKGRKILVKGNHDTLDAKLYYEIFTNIYGALFKYGFQITHVPVHPNSLRNRINVHGHLHNDVVRHSPTILNKIFGTKPAIDKRYFNVCPENLYKLVDDYELLLPVKSSLIKLDVMRAYLENRK